jgi:predicted metal-dependent peptidase
MATADAFQASGHRGTRAVQRLVEFAPSTGGLALWVHHRDLPAAAEGDVEPIAGPPVFTDGTRIHYLPAFEELPLPEQAGWVAHEVLHIALRHPQRFLALQQRLGDVDLRLFNTCADAIVNSALSHLGWLALPPGAVQLRPLLAASLALQQDTESALLAWDVERLYRAIDDRVPPESGRSASARSERQGEGQSEGQRERQREAERQGQRDGPRAARVRAMGGSGPMDLQPAPGPGSAPEDAAEQAREWAERLLRAHTGDGAHSLLRALLADLPKSRTPWELLLRTQLARGLAQRPEVAWSRPSRSYMANQGRLRSGVPGTAGQPGPARRGAAASARRMPFEPGISATRPAPRLVLVVDVSGSIDAPLMQRFAREIEALSRRMAAALVLVVGDERVQQVLHFRPGRRPLSELLKELRFEGGGTDFTPLLEEAGRHRPDLVVVLTDLDGPARELPRWPVIWAVPEAHADAVAPFGRKLVLA